MGYWLLINPRRDTFYFFKFMMDSQEETIEERLRREALKRVTDYNHPQITLSHQPINARQCEELQTQLRELVRQKVEQVRREYQAQDYESQYSQVYGEFVMMTGANQSQRQKTCEDIRQMHEMADMLMHPPDFQKGLYLNSNTQSNALQEEEFKELYEYYQKKYKAGEEVQENQALDVIRRAKQYYLRDRS